jgi:hypothetical protein
MLSIGCCKKPPCNNRTYSRKAAYIYFGFLHCRRMSHWYQHISAGQKRAGTNVPEQCKAGPLVRVEIPAGTNVPSPQQSDGCHNGQNAR